MEEILKYLSNDRIAITKLNFCHLIGQESPNYLEIGPHENIENYGRARYNIYGNYINNNYINNTLLYGINI